MTRRKLLASWILILGFAGIASAGQAAKEGATKEELRVDINHAAVAELTKLPGVGEQVAKRIVAYREQNGPFQKTEELMNVRGIGEKSYLKLELFLTLGTGKEQRKK